MDELISPFIESITKLIELISCSQITNKSKCLQDILSALRGPDISHDESSFLKWYTTSRIRAIVCPAYVGDVNIEPLTRAQMHKRDTMLMSSNHFESHYFSACMAIRALFGYDLKTEQELTGAKQDNAVAFHNY
jgi:hypothetical protein